jgi:WD40 repeat protein
MPSFPKNRLDRARGVRAVIDDYLDRRAADPSISMEGLIQLHAHLMPELGEQLFKLSAIESAARTAGVASDATNHGDAAEEPNDLDGRSEADGPPRRFGDYELLDEIGRGGMGVVYRAWQTSLARIVALKVILAGQMAAPEEVDRFRDEAAMAAGLDHPGIVPVYAFGTCRGQPYYAMALVDGPHLGALSHARPLAQSEAAQYVRQIAEAVAHAHSQGVVHRDLKPSNVLVDADGHIRITDFGLATWIGDGSHFTATGRILGTPDYMSPEQALADRASVGPASDIYALGAILYELIVGRPPFKSDSALATLKQVADAEPVPPRLFNPSISRDLETICLKCLEKDPARRYGSPAALADDLDRFLTNRPILARPIGKTARGWRWCRRNPAVAALSLVVVVALLGGTVVSAYFAVDARRRAEESDRAWKRADEERQRVVEHQRTSDALLSDVQARHGLRLMFDEFNHYGLLHLLAARQTADRLPEARDLRASLWAASHRVIKDRLVHLVGHDGAVVDVAVSPDGKVFATASEDGTARMWDVKTGRPRSAPLVHAGAVNMLTFSRDSQLLATASHDHTARLWRTATGEPHGRPMRHQGGVVAVALSPNGRFVATGSNDSTVRIWDAATGNPIGVPMPHNHPVAAVVFSPSGKLLASSTHEGTVHVWKADEWKPAFEPLKFRCGPRTRMSNPDNLIFSPNEKLLATVGRRATDKLNPKRGVQLIDTTTGKTIGPELEHSTSVRSLAFSSDGNILVTASASGWVHVWSPVTGKKLATRDAHAGEISSLAISADGKSLVTGSWDASVKLWAIDETDAALHYRKSFRHFDRVWKVGFTPDGSRLVSASEDRSARVWSGQEPVFASRLSSGPSVTSADMSGDGKLVVTASKDHDAQIRDSLTGQPVGNPLRHDSPVVQALFSPDGTLVATASKSGSADGQIVLWRTDDGRRHGDTLPHPGVMLLAFRPDGKMLASASDDGTVRFWDVATGRLHSETKPHAQRPTTLTFSRDGCLFGSNSSDGTVGVWDLKAGRVRPGPLLPGSSNVQTLAFSPQGDLLATGGWDSTVRLWSAASGTSLGQPLQHGRAVSDISFSSDGKLLASASDDRNVRLWDTTTWKLHGEPLSHPAAVVRVAFSPNGQIIAAGCNDGEVTLWQTSTRTPLARYSHRDGDKITRLVFAADGNSLLSVGLEESYLYRLWTVPSSLREIELRTWLAIAARINDQGVMEPIAWSEWQRLRDELATMSPARDLAN